MGLFDRLGRLLRSEATAARRQWDARRPQVAGTGSGKRRARAEQSPEAAADDDLARHYARLEVPYGSDLDAVRAGYRRVMKRYHPDRHSRDEEKSRIANDVAAALTASYDALVEHLERARR